MEMFIKHCNGRNINNQMFMRSIKDTVRHIYIMKYHTPMQKLGTKHFEYNETTLCDTVMVVIGHYTFVKIHRIYITKSEPMKTMKLG